MSSPEDGVTASMHAEPYPTGSLPPVIPAGHWVVDPLRSTVSFIAKHLLVSKVTGTFTRVAGSIHIAEDPTNSSVHAMADATSLQTGDTARDEHLRSPDFFDVEQYPTLTVTGRGIGSKSGRHVLEAELTIRDVTKPVVFEVTATNLNPDSSQAAGPGAGGGRPTVRFTADAVVNRKDFGLRWNAAIETGAVVVGDMITLTIVAVAELAA